jgi:hypothetical protein
MLDTVSLPELVDVVDSLAEARSRTDPDQQG